MLKKSLVAAAACAALGSSVPALAQSLPQWAPSASLGGAIGGRAILGATRHDNAPLWALNIDRMAHVTGRYDRAIAKFDRVVRPDGRVVVMRRIVNPVDPNLFAYLPKSWPPVGTLGVERIIGRDGSVVATREVVIPEHQVLAAGIPASGPPIGTIVVQRDVRPDGSIVVAQSVVEPEPGVMVALLGNDPALEAGRIVPGEQIVVAAR